MKPRELLPIIERVRRGTSNRDMVTICDALHDRLVKEMANNAVRSPAVLSGDWLMDGPPSRAIPYGAPGTVVKGTVPTIMQAIVERAEAGRKPAKGKAKRALARQARKRSYD